MAENKNELSAEILIIEDTPASLELLSKLMEGAGYQVRQAPDGEMALMSLKRSLPDLILLDVHMPGIDGFEVCRQLKADATTANIPIIFLSALHDSEARVKGLKLGAVDYICKPYEPENVLLRVKSNLELYNLRQRLEAMCDLRTRQLTEEINERKQAELALIESQHELRNLSGHLQDVREEERARIAREIHDELGQSLTVARIDLSRLLSVLGQSEEQLRSQVNNIINVIEQASNTARNISEDLRPGMLDLLGLGPAIQHHVMRFGESTGLKCSISMTNEGEIEVSNKVATAAFRIIQESLTNVARHACATKVDIKIVDLGSELMVVVHDDGNGMAEAPGDKQSHYGLLGMRERAELLGGYLHLDSTPGKGTRIEATLPHDVPTNCEANV